MKVKILKADERHRQDINRLMRKAKIGCFSKDEPIKNCWFVRHRGRVVACTSLDFHGPYAAILRGIVVEDELRHRGIGSKLIAHRMRIAKERGAKIVALVTVYYWYRFYKKRGFRTCPRAKLPESIKNYRMFTDKHYKERGFAVMYRRLRPRRG